MLRKRGAARGRAGSSKIGFTEPIDLKKVKEMLVKIKVAPSQR
jgi:hypothetical protein